MKLTAAPIKIKKGIKAENRAPLWAMPLAKTAIILVDAVIAAVSFIAAFYLREGGAILSETAWAWSKAFVPYVGILYFAVPVRLLMLAYQQVHNYHGAFSHTRELTRIFKATAVGSLLIVAWAFLFRGGFAFREFSYSRSVFIMDFAIAFAFFAVFHLLVRTLQKRIRNRGINLIPTIIVGTNPEAARTLSELEERRDLGYRVIGVVAAGNHVEPELEPHIIGEIDQLPEIIRELEIQEAIITDNSLSGDTLFEAMMLSGRDQKVEFRFTPNLFDLLPQKTSVEQLGVLPMVRLFREPLSDAQRLLKRVFDIVVAFVSIVVSLPLWAVIALLIKRDSPGPVLFRQERVGMDGRTFLCYKFRTMSADSDDGVHREAYKQNIAAEDNGDGCEDEERIYGKVPNDPRLTRFGRKLRRTSLDELPQLLNVLAGDMSIVGPRPPIPYEVVEYDIRHRKRLDMKPGITGLWQVSGRSKLRFEKMVSLDVYYIENWSIWLDLRIILMTIPAMLRGDGAK